MPLRLPPKKFFRPDELGYFLSLSRRTIYRMINDGRLGAVRFGSGPWRIPREEVLKLFSPGQVADHLSQN